MSDVLNRRAATLGFVGSLLAATLDAVPSKHKHSECSVLITACDHNPVPVPGPLLAFWLMRSMNHCITKPLDDAIAAHDETTVAEIAGCLGLTKEQHDFLHGVYQKHSAAFQALGEIWKNELLSKSNISSFKGFSNFTNGYTGHACPTASQLFKIAKS